ncbi:MAG TPA: hypothetical protein VMF52_17070 [Steroidobacteraceae bacterium]|nr:hypothetical protein [Steroidobacteraceae bacterium]
MKALTVTRRLSYAVAFLLIGSAVFNVSSVPAPDWFADAVVRSAAFAAGGFLVLIAVLELFAKFVARPRGPIYLLLFALLPLLGTGWYVARAAWFGRDVAKFDTWHLVSLFAIVHFVWMILAAGLASLLLMLGFAVADRARRRA